MAFKAAAPVAAAFLYPKPNRYGVKNPTGIRHDAWCRFPIFVATRRQSSPSVELQAISSGDKKADSPLFNDVTNLSGEFKALPRSKPECSGKAISCAPKQRHQEVR
eukprot:CAMPEP_0168755812 /NCGR_PEP_ID=MMETSP0724-20121128/20269_1 /TAXON_ID=265536 /ORGANISM="Amphiprora sp., Strain CCMP467" /LENGTH=105 /DNA_ID=CAMNT_0008804453 /DNA_START=238 /DNA_END=555 /DNA_ORIENTATION=-